MGLLKGVGRKLGGLLRSDGFTDSLSQAQAFLEGDYGRGMSLAGRAVDRRRALRERRRAQEAAELEARSSIHEAANSGAMVADDPYVSEGMIRDDPVTGRRMIRRNGEWVPFGP
jgi:hypothetical protein